MKIMARYNNGSVNMFFNDYSKHIQGTKTLNLRGYSTVDAVLSLDNFVDDYVRFLIYRPCKSSHYISIVTNRGIEREGAVSKVRATIISRFYQRKLKFNELDPGLFQVKVNKYSHLTSDL